MADHDQQYLIELDGNQTANTLFKVTNSLSLSLNILTCKLGTVPHI